ncbi:MAG: hypothetical protein K2Y21_06225 [Phycisphaerales bacterium]|nr:hypothetical protein [Phycisphaerales bacterium]
MVEATNTPETSFLAAAEACRRGMQAALTDMLADAGLHNARPSEVGRRLGLDKSLAWKISKVLESAETAEAFRHLPGRSGMEIVLRSATRRQVDAAKVERARAAFQEIEEFVVRHAGDRRTFEAMLAGEQPDAGTEAEERRAYFRAGAAIWGVRAAVQFLMLALKPSAARPGYLDVAQVSGLVNLERLRPDVPWIVRRLRANSDSGASVFQVTREPLVRERAERGLPPLFDAYCSSPLPELRQFEGSGGWIYDELVPGEVGRRGAATVVLGERYIGIAPMERGEDNTTGEYSLTVRTPSECVLFDLLLHRDLAHFGRPTRAVYGLLEDRQATSVAVRVDGGRPALLTPVPATDLGTPATVQTRRLAFYPGLVTDALAAAGFGGLADFRGYRAELEYPPFPCDLRLVLEIAARPARALTPSSTRPPDAG